MVIKHNKPVFPIVISILFLLVTIFIVQTYKQSLTAYHTEITLPQGQTLYLSPEYVDGDLTIKHITNEIYIYETGTPDPQTVVYNQRNFQTSFYFDPNKPFTKNCGVTQGGMKLVLDSLQCKCLYGLCPEIQNLNVTIRTFTEKFDQPYLETQQNVVF